MKFDAFKMPWFILQSFEIKLIVIKKTSNTLYLFVLIDIFDSKETRFLQPSFVRKLEVIVIFL